MDIVIADSKDYIYITVTNDTEESLSWEQLQKIKDKFYENLDFIEIYPRKLEIVNNANVRHLVHIKDWICPKLEDFEVESDIRLIEYYARK